MVTYRTYTIQKDFPNPYGNAQFMFYPTAEGVQHDGDCRDGETFTYCGNCIWTDTIEDAKSEIDDIIINELGIINGELLEACNETLAFLSHIEGRVGEQAFAHIYSMVESAITKAKSL